MKQKKLRNNDTALALVFILPALILVAAFMVAPLLRSVYISTLDWNGVTAAEAVGIKNYTKMFEDKKFWEAFQNTIIYSIFTVIFTTFMGLLLAAVIDRRVRGWNVFKFVFYIPVMLSTTVVSVLFTKILEPNYGFVNTLLKTVGLEALAKSWLGDPNLALGTVIVITIWQYCGFTMILFIAAMDGISPSVQEAATLDGVGEVQRVLLITIPCIKRSIYVVLMLQIIFSFKSFDMIWIMTKGGPGTSSEILSTLLYKTAFHYHNFGSASAIAVFMMVIIGIISMIYLRVSNVGEQVIE